MAKDILQKYFDGTNWIEMHPVTKSSNVYNESGKTVDEIITNLTTQVSNLTLIINNLSNPFTMNLYSDMSVLELGMAVDSINFSWTYNKIPFSQEFEGNALDVSVRNYNYTSLINTDTEFTLTAVPYDGGPANVDTLTIKFLNGIYYGVSSSTTYDDALIDSLMKDLSDNKSRTISVNALSDQYIYYCIPSRLGSLTFKVGGFDGGFDKVNTLSFMSSSGYTENYDIYRSDNLALGEISVEIV